MNVPIKINTIRLGLSIIYFKRSQVEIPKFRILRLVRIVFILDYSADPDEMPQFATFHLGLHCFKKYPFKGFQ